ncbi:helix-turn-helix domain-containing protein [Pedobacter sp. LMG 31464]|uniref:Helix-turn-helix domain-containing protein n=1 Tax=Pedobacter planticolens TaxID=2679964 RepID=A0A923E3N7_9SPHI|nr:helix-turn-helix transcriptional regulator [Pedobacter planticolens]MBB2146919.1 helix-turn-helix domain-containing protein [Pedobacter planticolens]
MTNDLEIFKKNLGKRIANLREAKGLTQAQLSALINKDFQSISRIETGRVNASSYLLKQIADALEITMSDLFDF